jgi:Peptidase C10 family/Immune inhibitor A-like, MAM domain
LGGPFGAYAWANMPDSTDSGYTPEQAAAVAELCYEMGVAYNMDYGACASGAYTQHAITVFPEYFKFRDNVIRLDRTDYNQADWYQAVADEIDVGRVILYSIHRHAIVCDGYRQSGSLYQYHMNYGWGNGFNAWYTLDSLYCGWDENDLCPISYDFMIVNLDPMRDPVLDVSGLLLSDEDGDDMLEIGELVEVSAVISNSSWPAVNTKAHIRSLYSRLLVIDDSCIFADTIGTDEQAVSLTNFTLQVGENFMDPTAARVEVTVTPEFGETVVDTLQILLGTVTGIHNNVEAGQPDWTHEVVSPSSFLSDEWHLDNYRSHSGVMSWKAGGIGAASYSNYTDGGLATRPILLPPDAQLTFWHWLDAVDGPEPGEASDAGLVMISTGYGWEVIEPVDGYTHVFDRHWPHELPSGTPCYSGTSGWTMEEFDLSAYSGHVQILFRFLSDTQNTSEGWYIDDIDVRTPGCCITTGNVDGSSDGLVTMGDLTVMIDHLFISLTPLDCVDAGNVDLSADNLVTMGDLTVMIDHLYITLSALPLCP